MIGCIGKMLGFEAQAAVRRERRSKFLPAVYLKPGARRRHPQAKVAVRALKFGTAAGFAQNIVEVHTADAHDKRVPRPDDITQRRWLAQIQSGTGDIEEITGRQQVVVDLQDLPAGNMQAMPEHVGTASREIEIGVVGHVYMCRPVGFSFQPDHELAFIRPAVRDARLERSGVALVAIR